MRSREEALEIALKQIDNAKWEPEPDEQPDIGTELTLASIERIVYLREQIIVAMDAIMDGRPALGILQTALDETDVGKMKVWQPGEKPF